MRGGRTFVSKEAASQKTPSPNSSPLMCFDSWLPSTFSGFTSLYIVSILFVCTSVLLCEL